MTTYTAALVLSKPAPQSCLPPKKTAREGRGPITHGGDPKFVRGTMKNQWTWWFDAGSFDPAWFDRIQSMRLTSHC
ncbi:DUF6294 family protein [Amycolatopsis sp. NPDC049691]|uniref:DUF6294 family protein n=1 Tax=Amycolatopsis sp. NPDC049691 TaxID=3155155 RepID=UPI003435379C